jgi:hypothetical protein
LPLNVLNRLFAVLHRLVRESLAPLSGIALNVKQFAEWEILFVKPRFMASIVYPASAFSESCAFFALRFDEVFKLCSVAEHISAWYQITVSHSAHMLSFHP